MARKSQAEKVYDRPYAGFLDLESSLLTVGEVENRVIRACKTVRALPDREQRFLRNGRPSSVSLPIVQDFMDAYSSMEEARARFRPTPFDVTDFLVALGWCKCLTKEDFRFLWWRSFDNISFRVIASRIGRSDETARMRYRDALLRVWHVANTKQ